MIYLDHHAATPLSGAAARAMHEARDIAFANPSSTHQAGRRSRALIEQARDRLADAVQARASELVWTSGGTEACNMAVAGLRAERVVTSAFEHSAVVQAISRRGLPVQTLAAERMMSGAIEDLLDDTTLVAVQWVNHETGAIWNIRRIAQACQTQGARLFVDATQALGRVPVSVQTLGAQAVAFASHKVGGPSGVGALWLARSELPEPLLVGGGQERGRRAGTPGVEAIVGFGGACEVLPTRLEMMPRVQAWRDRLERTLSERGASVNAPGERVASVTNVSVPGWPSAVLVAALDLEGVCASAGSACSSGTPKPSPVIRALYPEAPWRAEHALRLSLGPESLDDDAIEHACEAIGRVLDRAGT